MNRILPWLSMAVSLTALALSALLTVQADARADAAMRRREKAFVARHVPAMQHMIREMQLVEPKKTPETFDELVEPLVRLADTIAK